LGNAYANSMERAKPRQPGAKKSLTLTIWTILR
jgi:hypothetical protein